VSVSLSQHATPVHLPLTGRLTHALTSSLVSASPPGPKIPIQGNLTYWGEYFTTVYLGNPPQSFDLQVDTGSSDVIVYGAKCKNCPPGSARYDASKSSSWYPIHCDDQNFYCNKQLCSSFEPCAFMDDFGGGSKIQGTVGYEKFAPVAGMSKTRISFGVINLVAPQNLSFEPTGVDGIWGLAHKPLSGWDGEPAIGLFIGTYNYYDSFSLCIYGNNGLLEIGTDYSSDSRFVWTPVQTVDGSLMAWYTVWLEDWKFGSTSLGLSEWTLNANNVVVDSGTTLLVVPKNVWQAILKTLLNMCSSNNMIGICNNPPKGQQLFNGDCIQMTAAQIAAFPTLTLSLYEMTKTPLTIDPIDYLWQGAGIPGYYCFGIQMLPSASLPIIIGDVFIQKWHVVFDREEAQVGWGPLSSCPGAQPSSSPSSVGL